MKKKSSKKKVCDMCLHERPLVMKTKRRVWNREKRRFNVVPKRSVTARAVQGYGKILKSSQHYVHTPQGYPMCTLKRIYFYTEEA